MPKPKLIVLNGFAASGKSTIARNYISNHSMALALEADALVDNIGDWINHEDEVRRLTFEITKSILRVYLPSGHDVILPYLVTNEREVQEFELIAQDYDADYYEIVLFNERAEAIRRLLKRGKWGEATSPALSEKDLPIIETLITKMETALERRPNAIKLHLQGKDPNATYDQLMQYIDCGHMLTR